MAVAGIDDQLTHPLWCEANAAVSRLYCMLFRKYIYVGT